ncbi:DUF1439 domain-containing protein [Escherichia coli]
MKLKLKALPVFDKEKGAIFLKEMEVVDASNNRKKCKRVYVKRCFPIRTRHYAITLTSNLLTSCAKMGSQGEAMAKKLAKGIEVKPGEIVIPFTDH